MKPHLTKPHTMKPNKANRLHPRTHDALLHEDLITPVHAHDPADDHLLAHVDGRTRRVTPHEAGQLVHERARVPELHEVEHESAGPRLVKRRHVLAGAAAGIGGMLAASALPRYSFAAPVASDHLLVVIFMRGAFDGLSAVVPVNDQAYYRARPSISVPAGATIPLTNGLALNRQLSALKPLYDQGTLAIAIGTGAPTTTRSHFHEQALIERAAPAQVRSGWVGRYLQTRSAATGSFRGITMGPSTTLSLTTTAFDTIAMSTIASFSLANWSDNRYKERFPALLEEMYGRAGGPTEASANTVFEGISRLAAERGRSYQPAGGAKYPDTEFGRGMKEVAQMAKSGLGVEAACIDYPNWDMHRGHGKATADNDWFSRQARDFALSLAAFRADLGATWNKVTVVTMSEFGRRVAENSNAGTDHGHASVMFVAGGGIRGGRIYGTQPALTDGNLERGDVPVSLDYRQLLADLVQKRLGNSRIAEIFPGFQPGKATGIV